MLNALLGERDGWKLRHEANGSDNRIHIIIRIDIIINFIRIMEYIKPIRGFTLARDTMILKRQGVTKEIHC